MSTTAPVSLEGPKPLAVYVHFPWCLEKCPYCDFVSFKTRREDIDHQGYADALLAELSARAPLFAGSRVQSVFFGGGTPSLFEPAQAARVITAIRERFELAQSVEITFECNPSSLDPARAAALCGAGANRLSVGVQSLCAEELTFLGRLHDGPGAIASVQSALGAVPRASADLIFGLPNQSPEKAVSHVNTLVALGLTHLSAYALTIEPGTRFGELHRRGRLPMAKEDNVAESFLAIEEALETHGFAHYEVSNYAKPGEASVHNLAYWYGCDYLGLGVAAVGYGYFEGKSKRYRNEADPARYIQKTHSLSPKTISLDDGLSGQVEELDAETLMRERIMLGLRLSDGLNVAAAEAKLGVVFWTAERTRAFERLEKLGNLALEGDALRVTKKARLLTDGIVGALF